MKTCASNTPNGLDPTVTAPLCDSYERRLAELIGRFQSSEHNLVAA